MNFQFTDEQISDLNRLAYLHAELNGGEGLGYIELDEYNNLREHFSDYLPTR